jgi:RHS repeat-associated protein
MLTNNKPKFSVDSSLVTDNGGGTYQVLHFTPFGCDFIDIRQPEWYNEMHRFTGYYKDFESGMDYANARYRDIDFKSPDDMWHLNPDIQSYHYCRWNPIMYVDRDGNKVEYAKGQSSQFKASFGQGIQHLNKHGAGGIFQKLEQLKQTVYIAETNSPDGSWYDHKTNTIYWNPELGTLTSEGIVMSPTTSLNHEGDHALQYNINPEQSIIDVTTPDSDYKNKEERRVITGSEQETAKKLGEIKEGEVTRKNYSGTLYKVESPTSTELVNAGATIIVERPKKEAE